MLEELARHGRAPGGGRLRHPLFEPRLLAALPHPRPEDRPVVRGRHRQGHERHRDRDRDDRHGQEPAPHGDRRRSGDRRTGGLPEGEGMRSGPGVFLRQAGCRPRTWPRCCSPTARRPAEAPSMDRRAANAAARAGILLLVGPRRQVLVEMPKGRSGHPLPRTRPTILLVTLDTTRADAIGPEAKGVLTPAFNALAARGRRFRQAYATVPETLPSHASMMTGLYPAGHGVHENARYLARRPAGPGASGCGKPATAPRPSSPASPWPGASGSRRGFDVYDDEMPAGAAPSDRPAKRRTGRSPTSRRRRRRPLFLWVHYYDPHAPYAPPEPFKQPVREDPVPRRGRGDGPAARASRRRAFEAAGRGPTAILVVGDHGEGLGEHGEAQHGRLLYQATVHVPLLLVGPGVAAGRERRARSAPGGCFTRSWTLPASGATDSLRGADAPRSSSREAMKPFLAVRMAAAGDGGRGTAQGDPRGHDSRSTTSSPIRGESTTSAPERTRPGSCARPFATIRCPSLEPPTAVDRLGEEERRKLASLGYVSAGAVPVGPQGRAAARGHGAAVRSARPGVGPLRARGVRAGPPPAARRSWLADPDEPRRRPAARDGALRPRARDEALAAFRQGRRDQPPLGGRPHLPRPALRARRRSGRRRCRSSSASSPRRPIACPRSRRWPRSASGRGRSTEAIAPAAEDLRAPHADSGRARAAGPAGHEPRQNACSPSSPSRRARAQGGAPAHDLELGVLYLAARRLRGSTRCPRPRAAIASRLPHGALQAGAGERPARTSPTRPRGSRAPARTPTPRPAPLIARERLFHGGVRD